MSRRKAINIKTIKSTNPQLPKFRQVVEESKCRNWDDVATNMRGPGKLKNYIGLIIRVLFLTFLI